MAKANSKGSTTANGTSSKTDGKPNAAPGPAKAALSEEIVIDSDNSSSDGDSESDAETGSGSDVGEVSSALEAAPSKASGAKALSNGSQQKSKPVSRTSDDSDESASSTEPSSSSEDEDEDALETSKTAKESVANQISKQIALPAPTPAPPYTPPSGFSALPTTAFSTTSTALLSAPSFSGKQIWHIVAPSSLSLSELKSISLKAIDSHDAVLTSNGTAYALYEDTGPSATNDASKKLLLPSSEGKNYSTTSNISRTLHLRQRLEMPKTQVPHLARPKEVSHTTRTIRPQATGLKMRYRPPGFGSGIAGPVGVMGSERGDLSDDDQFDDEELRQHEALQSTRRAEQRRRFTVLAGTSIADFDEHLAAPADETRVGAAGTASTAANSGKKRKRTDGGSGKSRKDEATVATTSSLPGTPAKKNGETAAIDVDEHMLDAPATSTSKATPKSNKKGTKTETVVMAEEADITMQDAEEDPDGAETKTKLTDEERAAKAARKAARAEKRAKTEAKRAARAEKRKSSAG